MERFKIKEPSEKDIVIRDRFVVNQLIPIVIKQVDENQYNILFFVGQDVTESAIYLQTILIVKSNEERKFLNFHQLNINNVRENADRLKFYIEATESLTNDTLFITDFDMKEDSEAKSYYKALGIRKLDNKGHCSVMDLFITRDNFISINLFLQRLATLDITAETVFMNNKLSHIEFININHVKLDASSIDVLNNVVFNHYTCGCGPTQFRFNYISPVIKGRKLRNPLIPSMYNTFYQKDFIVTDLVYDHNRDCIYALFEERSPITYNYKSTKALRFGNDIYNKTNFIEYDKIYEEEEQLNSEESKA